MFEVTEITEQTGGILAEINDDPLHVYLLIALFQDKRKATELEAIMKKQKMKADLKAEGGEF